MGLVSPGKGDDPDAVDFPVAFAALTGAPAPVSWQTRLFGKLRDGDVPPALDLPTGLGKTSVIVLWLLALASGARIGRRLFYIVDRRVVVDQATLVAEGITEALAIGSARWQALSDTERRALLAVRAGLGLGDAEAPVVSTLRGQHIDNRLWLRRPASPAIVVGTVDMIGSRLLFSGYGVSRWMRPVHAGLVAMDSLLVLDESHLVPPFEHLLDAARERAEGGFARVRSLFPPSVSPFRLLRLSATGRQVDESTFGLEDEDYEDPWVAGRLHAAKRLDVIAVEEKDLIDEMASRAAALAGEGGAVAVFCNGFEQAQKVADAIAASGASDVARLTGQVRVRERARLADDPTFRRFADRRAGTAVDGPAFLVCTSAGEVGIDFDADHAVCDLVSWERMVQRLGRVNRAGRDEPARIAVLAVRPSKKEAAERFDLWSAPFRHPAWTKSGSDGLDGSLAALRALREDERFLKVSRVAETPEPFRPPLTSAELDAWAMTSVSDHPGRAAVAPWLRGWIDEEGEAVIAWRARLPGRAHVDPYLEDAPVHLLESLSVPASTANKWLARVTRRFPAREADDTVDATDEEEERSEGLVAAIRLRDDDAEPLGVEALARRARSDGPDRGRFLRGGDALIIDAGYGGLAPHGVLDGSIATPPLAWDREPVKDENVESESFDAQEAIPRRWREGAIDEDPTPGFVPGAYREPVGPEPQERHRWIEIRRKDEVTTATSASRSLSHHHADAEELAERTCRELGLVGALRTALVQAARHHDLGKSRATWQRAAGAPEGETLAKVSGRMNARLLGGYRHEFGSVSDVVSDDLLHDVDELERELALHLVASHHGRARPWIHAVDPAEPPPFLSDEPPPGEALAIDIARRFDERQAHLGHWPLCWLEAVLRAVDWEASERADGTEAKE